MNLVPETVKYSENKHILSMFVKEGRDKTLVLETKLGSKDTEENYLDILNELPLITKQAQKDFGDIKNVDIRLVG